MDDGERAKALADYFEEVGIAEARSKLPEGESRMTCIDCGANIPEGRRKAMSGCERCVACQEQWETI